MAFSRVASTTARRLLVASVAAISLVTVSTGAAPVEPQALDVEKVLSEHGLTPADAPHFSERGVAHGQRVEAVVSDDAALRVRQPGSSDFIEITPLVDERQHEESQGSFVTFEVDGGTTAVQALPDGGRIVEVVEEAPTGSSLEFSYDIHVPTDVRLVQSTDGSIAAVRDTSTSTEGSMQVIGMIKKPWALDAQGRPQPVAYTLDGSTITMTVTPDATAQFPITADPEAVVGDFRFNWSVLSPHIVTAYANKRGSQAINIGSGALCAAIALVPVFGAVLSVMCFVNEAMLGIGQLYGKCQYVRFNAVSRTFAKGLYSDGFCR